MPDQLATIEEQDTVIGGSAGSDPIQPAATSSPRPAGQQEPNAMHAAGDGPPPSQPLTTHHVWPANRGPQPQMRMADHSSPAEHANNASPSANIFSPLVRREVQEVTNHTNATPRSTRRENRNRRLSRHWTSPPMPEPGGPRRRRQAPVNAEPPARTRADARRLRNEEREREQREVQMVHERRREVLRDNIRRQHEAAQQRHRPQPDHAQELAAAEGADTAILRQFLTEKERDVHGNFGETIASLLRRVPGAVSGKLMSEVFVYVNKVCHFSGDELDNYLNAASELR
ncbi:uncharacterized protein LOC117643027 [Thrips palmi]|uniref:Uncharacterized protein LOC117643027 n=1 Tax=Thrips palmi TaxID=161013 RepID=A0A6P8ZKR4_THRPL|nr:uncharacterized protein LOC117643027 [Thrips palmi]